MNNSLNLLQTILTEIDEGESKIMLDGEETQHFPFIIQCLSEAFWIRNIRFGDTEIIFEISRFV